MGIHLPNASVSFTLVLCSCAFFLGRFSMLPSHSLEREVDTIESTRHLTQVDENSGEALPFNPLDPRWEQPLLEASGLLKVRPPLPAAASGDHSLHVIPFQILSWYPRVVVYPGFIDKARCEAIIRVANDTMYPSTVAFRPTESYDANQQTRTSTGAYVSAGEDSSGALTWLEERIATIALIRPEYGEPFNILHYENGQHYDSHYDTFDPKEYGPQRSQRIATVLTILSAPDEGGETVFKREGKDGADRPIADWRSCDDGSFKYVPRQGDAILFWTVKTNGEIDTRALHGGCPVKRGEKWVATKWIRSRPVFGHTEE